MKTRLVSAFALLLGFVPALDASTLEFPARTRAATDFGTDIRLERIRWDASKTTLIVCDFWDSHHCYNAVKRVNEMAPRLAAVVEDARRRGVFIIHSPSDCMDNYAGHPARRRAESAPRAANLPDGIDKWLHWKNEVEEKTGYPIDHSDGGSDDTPEEAAAWKKQLAAEGRDKQKWPWRGEHPAIRIDPERDAISDKGIEVWNLLEQRGITNVLFAGVHTNMCVCGRPFGLRQLSNHGKNIVLLRDLTDTMYNPAKPPFVSHYRGTELMLAHIERLICPTTSSGDVFGGASHTFGGDKRPHLAVMLGEDEYKTGETVPAFLETECGRDFRISYIIEPEPGSGDFAGCDALANADVLFISVRRRTLPRAQLDAVRAFVARRGALVAIRTSSHAFALRGTEKPPEGRDVWPEFDAYVLGGNYQGHYGNDAKTFAVVSMAPSKGTTPGPRPIIRGIAPDEFPTGGSLYKNTPLRDRTTVLLTGRAEGIPRPEPVAWTHAPNSDARVFYTSLGHVDDFKRPEFRRLLTNAVRWAAALPTNGGTAADSSKTR